MGSRSSTTQVKESDLDVQERIQSLPDGRSPAMGTPAPTDLAEAKRVDSTVRGNLQQASGGQAAAKGDKADSRETFIKNFRAWLEERMANLIKLKGQDKVEACEACLAEIEGLFLRFNNGEAIDFSNVGAGDGGENRKVKRSYAPPELISDVRQLIEMVERPVEEATGSKAAVAEGSLYSDKDWNSRLGIPQYRTQSDNLASPEATCNVTSMAMALERLGYGRDNILGSIDGELKKSYAQAQKKGSKVTFEEWQEQKIKDYLAKENKAGKPYQKLRGQANTAKTLEAWSEGYLENAQMEDLLDFLTYLKGVHRTTIISDPTTILPAVQGGSKLTHQKIDRLGEWQKFSEKIRKHLNGGGAAAFSFRHKGKGQSGTHIISIQSVEADGFIVDDPYGRIRANYAGNEAGDAYSDGKTRNRKNKVDRSENNLEDWEVDRAQSPEESEDKGDSYKFSKASIESSFNYVMLLGRNDTQAATGGTSQAPKSSSSSGGVQTPAAQSLVKAKQTASIGNLDETKRVDGLVRSNLAQGLQTQAATASKSPSSDELTERIARCIGIWETNRGKDNPNPRESDLDTVAGVKASMATIEQATMPYAIDALKRNKGLREQATPALTMKELTAANDRCVAVSNLLSTVKTAEIKNITPDNFIQTNADVIAATGLSDDDVQTMFDAVVLRETLDQIHESSSKVKDKKRRKQAVRDGIATIAEDDRLGLGEGSLTAYINKPEKWGENRAAWQRKAVNLMPNNVGSRIESIAESSNGTGLAIPVIKARVDAALATKPTPNLETLVQTVAQQNNPKEKNYGVNVWATYARLYP